MLNLVGIQVPGPQEGPLIQNLQERIRLIAGARTDRRGYSNLPDKVYKDCLNCQRRRACDEVAMVRGKLPDFSRLEPARAPRARRRKAARA